MSRVDGSDIKGAFTKKNVNKETLLHSSDNDFVHSPPKKQKLDNAFNDFQQAIPSTSRQETFDLNETFAKESEVYKASGVKCALHGTIYQCKLLTLFTKRGIAKGYKFRLATDMVAAEKFDDLVFEYEENDQTFYSFLQAKHSLDTDEVVTEGALMTLTNGKYSLQKYFVSFCKINKNELFQKGDLKDFTICTSVGYNKKTCKDFLTETIIEEGDILHVAKNEKKLQIEEKCADDDNFLLNLELAVLKSALELNFIQHNSNCNDVKGALKKFETDTKKRLSTEDKKKLLDQLKKPLKYIENLGVSGIQDIFENYRDEVRKSIKPKNLVEILKKIKHNTTQKKIDEIGRMKNLDEAIKAGLTIIDMEEKTVKTILTLALDDSKLREQIAHFVKKFRLIVDYPNEEELGKIIKKELGEEFLLLNADLVSDSFEKQMLDWFKQYKKGYAEFLTPEESEGYLDSIKKNINTLLMTGLNTAFPEKLRVYQIKFKSTTDSFLKFNKLVEDILIDQNKRILHIKSKNIRLSSIKLFQILEKIKEFENQDSFIFVKLETLLRIGVQKLVTKSFSSKRSHNVLIIECPKIMQQERKIQELFENLSSVFEESKKIIFIAHDDDVLCNKFKENIYPLGDTSVFGDLDTDSQTHLLNHTRVILQIKDPSKTDLHLKDFLDESLAESIVDDGDVLSYLIEKCNEGTSVEIGNDKAFSSTGYIHDYYVNRYFRRQLINTEVLKKHHNSEFFFVRGATKNDLVKLGVQEDTVCEKMDGQTSNTTIILSAKENPHESFEDICTKNPDKNIHLLEYRFPHLFWIKSKGEISTLHKNVENYYNPLSYLKTLSEEQFIENINQKVLLLANDSGMGKSTVITNMAHRIKEKSQTTWLVRINLNDYANEKPNSLGKIDKNKNILDFLTEMIIPSSNEPLDEFQSKLFRTALDKAGKFGVVIFIDGFDEISPTYKDKTSLLLEALKNSSITQFWVTTRVHEKEYLEKLLQTPSYILCHFCDDDQKHFLGRYFRWKLTFPEETLSEESRERILEHFEQSIKSIEKLSESKYKLGILKQLCCTLTAVCDVFVKGSLETAGKFLKEISKIKDRNVEHYLDFSDYVEILLENFLEAVKGSDETFTFVPIHLKMLADIVFENKFQLPANIQLSSLYQSFVKIKFDIYHREKSATPAGNVGAKTKDDIFSEILRKVHYEFAVKLFFPEEKSLSQLNKFVIFENLLRNSGKDLSQELARVGFVCLIEGELKFVHRSYAEYFLSEYFCENLQNKEVQNILFGQVFHKDEYFLIRKMFNDRLNKYYDCKSTKQKLMQDACDVNLERVISLTYFHENLYNFEYIVETAIYENHFGIILLIFEKYKDRENIIEEIFSNDLLYGLAAKLGQNRNTCVETLWKSLLTSPKILKEVLFNSSDQILTATLRADNYVILKIILDMCTNTENDLKHLIPIIKQQLKIPIFSILQTDHANRIRTLLDILKDVPDLFESFFFSVKKGKSLIQWAVCNQRFEILNNILTTVHNSDVEKKLLLSADSSGKTLLFSVCEVEQYDVAQSLVNAASENIIEDLTVISAHPKDMDLQKSVEILIKAVSENSKIYQNLISIQKQILLITEKTYALHIAIKKKNVDTVKEIYSDNGDIQKHLILARNDDAQNFLELAVESRDPETVVYFLQNFCKHDNVFRTVLLSIDDAGKTLLHKAVLSGNTEIVKAFLTDINSDFLMQLLLFVDDKKMSPFDLAICCGHHQILKLFLKEINEKFPAILKYLVLGVNSGLAPLHLAVSNNNTNIISDLIDFVKNNISEVYEKMLLSTNREEKTILHLIFAKGHGKSLNLLLDKIEIGILKKMLLIVYDENDIAAIFGKTEILSTFFDWLNGNVVNTDPAFLKNLVDTESGPILYLAVLHRHYQTLECLIEFFEQNVGDTFLREILAESLESNTGRETLFYSFTQSDSEITTKFFELTKKYLNQECRKKIFLHADIEGQTILIHAVQFGNSEMLQSLLETVTSEMLNEMVLKVDCDGLSALSCIALSDDITYDIMQTFLESTKKYCSNSIFRKMLLMAVDKRERNFLSVFASKGDIDGIKIAFSVLKDEFDDLIKDLLITSVDCCNRTVLHWAYWNNHIEIVEFLLQDLKNCERLHQKLFSIKLQLDEVKVDKETLEEAILKKDAEKIEFVFQKVSSYNTENKREFMKSLFEHDQSLLDFAAKKAGCDTFKRLMQHMDENIFEALLLEFDNHSYLPAFLIFSSATCQASEVLLEKVKKHPRILKKTLLNPRHLLTYSDAIREKHRNGKVLDLLKNYYYKMAESLEGSDVNFDFNIEELESLARCLKNMEANRIFLYFVLKHIEINKNRI